MHPKKWSAQCRAPAQTVGGAERERGTEGEKDRKRERKRGEKERGRERENEEKGGGEERERKRTGERRREGGEGGRERELRGWEDTGCIHYLASASEEEAVPWGFLPWRAH